jgi:hypothetical protein
MNRNKKFAGITILSILILACQQASGLIPTPTPLMPTATTGTTSTATITVTPTATAFLALQGDPITFKAGGFTVAPLRGYDREVNSYQAFLKSADERVTIFLLTEAKPSGKTPIGVVNSYMEYFKEVTHDFSEGESLEIVIDSAQGISRDYAGTLEEEPLHGRVAIVFPDDSKILTVIVQTVGEGRWESEGELAYAALIKTISFFKPEISSACLVAKNPDYGYTIDLPVQIGGDEANGPDREEEYLSGLLGPRGEIVSFYRAESIETNGVVLDKFIVTYKNTQKTLYMDMYTYNKPQFPFGFNCSTTAPLVP